MRSSVSVTGANLVTEDIEERALEAYCTEIPVWKRYMDDTSVVIRDLIEQIHSPQLYGKDH